jgi:hypothetical protein
MVSALKDDGSVQYVALFGGEALDGAGHLPAFASRTAKGIENSVSYVESRILQKTSEQFVAITTLAFLDLH